MYKYIIFIILVIFSCVKEKNKGGIEFMQRPKNVPEGAIWAGGVDGGVWIYIKEKGIQMYYAEIYTDVTGYLWYKGNFKLKQSDSTITIEKIKNNLSGYDGELIFLTISNYYLIPISNENR